MDRRTFLQQLTAAGALAAGAGTLAGELAPKPAHFDGVDDHIRLEDLPRYSPPVEPGTVFQDAAGTIPALKDGDPVGCWKGFCGPGTFVVFPTVARRPTLRGGALCFDGIDDPLA